ncbi:MAG: 4Fe-4S dicluster domain-containing protein [Desulfitobacteriaceae bacterium]
MSKQSPLLNRRTILKLGALASLGTFLGINVIRPKWALALGNLGGGERNSLVQGKQMGFLYDQTKCIGCHACQGACKRVNKWEEGVMWRRVLSKGERMERVYLSMGCNHCAHPACVSVCPVSAYRKRPQDGIVEHDREKCIGCKYCLYACPYHVPMFSEATGRISKCHFCYTRQEAGQKPACVEACPMQALNFGEMKELLKIKGGVQQVNGLPDRALTGPSLIIIPKKSAGDN